MSHYTECDMTLTLGREERDCHVRAFVLVEPGLGMGGAWGATLDGGVDIWPYGAHDGWAPADSFDLGALDVDRIEEALCERAMEEAGE